jgi:hypothetical protein
MIRDKTISIFLVSVPNHFFLSVVTACRDSNKLLPFATQRLKAKNR